MTFGLSLHSNHVAMKNWSDGAKEKNNEDLIYVALMAIIDQLSKKIDTNLKDRKQKAVEILGSTQIQSGRRP